MLFPPHYSPEWSNWCYQQQKIKEYEIFLVSDDMCMSSSMKIDALIPLLLIQATTLTTLHIHRQHWQVASTPTVVFVKSEVQITDCGPAILTNISCGCPLPL